MEEFLISTTLTSDLIKRYTDSIGKLFQKSLNELKFLEFMLVF